MTKGQAAERAAEAELGIVRTSEELFGKRARAFERLVGDYRGISETLKSLEEEKKQLQKQIQQYFVDAGTKTVLADSSRVTLVQNQGQSRVDKVKLLEHGVSAQVIADCTVTGNPFEYVKVTPAKE